MPGPLPQPPKLLPEPHFDMPANPTTMPCEQLGKAIADVEAELRWTEKAIKHVTDERAKADELGQDAYNQHNPQWKDWQKIGDDLLREQMRLHDLQAKLQAWLTEARYQQATRCVCETSTSTGPKVAGGVVKKVAAGAVAVVAAAAGLGYALAPAKADPEPVPAAVKMYAKDVTPKPKPQPSTRVTIQLKAVDGDGNEVGGGHFTVKTISKLSGSSRPEPLDEPDAVAFSLQKDWQGIVEYEAPDGWIVVGSNPSGGEVRVQGGAVDNGFGQPLVRHTDPDGNFVYEVIFQVRRKVVPHQPKRPVDGPLGEEPTEHHDSSPFPPPTTPLGGNRAQEESRQSSTGSSGSSGSMKSTSCTSNGTSSDCTSNTGGESRRGTDSSQRMDTYVGEPQVSGGGSSQPSDNSQTAPTNEETRNREPVG